MSDDDDTEKPYDATPRKLEEARRKGDIPRSADLTVAASYAGFVLTALVFGAASVQMLGTVLAVLLDQSDSLSRLVLQDGGRAIAAGLMGRTLLSLAPWFAAPAVLVLVALAAQQSFTVTGSKLQAKLSRISPVANFKNKFGRSGLFEFAKSFAKLVLISTVLGFFLRGRMPEILASVDLGGRGTVALMVEQCVAFFTSVLAIAVVMGIVDFLWQRLEFQRRQRMSLKEMIDENKNTEGDPHMKQQRRQRGYDIATNRMLADVPKADVVVVNPEHYAVALKWSREKGSAPVCVAKGVDEIAARIRQAAITAGVPLHRDPPTARALHATTEVGQQIDRQHYRAVAAAIRFADRMRQKGKRR